MNDLIGHQKRSRLFKEAEKSSNDPRYRKAWNLLKSYTPGKILDIGCANGAFSSHLIELGWDVWGVDASEDALLEAKNKGIKTMSADVSTSLPFENQSFDFLFAGEIIEHQIDDRHFLAECYRVLKPKGILILTTPNLVSLQNRFFMLFGKTSAPAVAEQHYKVYTLDSLAERIQSAGFKIRIVQSSHIVISRTRNNILGIAGEFLGKIFPRFGEQFVILCSRDNIKQI
jgi:SAM-dependent methyltransferase